MADARTEAVEAVVDALEFLSDTIDDQYDDPQLAAGVVLDAIPTAALVRLVIERGGLEQMVSAARALLERLDGYAVCRGCGLWINREDHKADCLTEALRVALDRLSEEPT